MSVFDRLKKGQFRGCATATVAVETRPFDAVNRPSVETVATVAVATTQYSKPASLASPSNDAACFVDDDRVTCLACRNLQAGNRCANWKAADIAHCASQASVPADLEAIPQRCLDFVPLTAGVLLEVPDTIDAPTSTPAAAPTGWNWPAASWFEADAQYQGHASTCSVCRAAGKGYTSRCDDGEALWRRYTDETKARFSESIAS